MTYMNHGLQKLEIISAYFCFKPVTLGLFVCRNGYLINMEWIAYEVYLFLLYITLDKMLLVDEQSSLGLEWFFTCIFNQAQILIHRWVNPWMKNPGICRADCTMPFYMKDLSILRFWCGDSWNKSPMYIEVQLYLVFSHTWISRS